MKKTKKQARTGKDFSEVRINLFMKPLVTDVRIIDAIYKFLSKKENRRLRSFLREGCIIKIRSTELFPEEELDSHPEYYLKAVTWGIQKVEMPSKELNGGPEPFVEIVIWTEGNES